MAAAAECFEELKPPWSANHLPPDIAPQYFPSHALALSDRDGYGMLARTYALSFRGMSEPSLLEPGLGDSLSTYRFTSISFATGMERLVRLVVRTDMTGEAVVKVCVKGVIKSAPPAFISREKVQEFMSLLRGSLFWSLPSIEQDDPGERFRDGQMSLIEGSEGGKYHVVHRWNSQAGPLFAISKYCEENFLSALINK
jgi:hypothetical protein